jgi:insertion element IS1 protein InsB
MFLDAVDIHAYALKKESIRSHHDLRGQQLEQFEQEILMILPWLKLLSGFNVAFWCTDGYRAYNDELPQEKHIVGKLYTQRIERENLTLRNRLKRLNRKTLGYSKSPEMHDRIIGTFIEREYYV